MTYYLAKTVAHGFDDAVDRTIAALKAEGFGVLTEIDVDKVLKAKLGAEFRRYKILGACNPSLAHQALLAEAKVGLLLPCNLVIQDLGEGRTEVAAINPVDAMGSVGNPSLVPLADTVRDSLQRVIDAV